MSCDSERRCRHLFFLSHDLWADWSFRVEGDLWTKTLDGDVQELPHVKGHERTGRKQNY
jgi:hypothetical protein